MMRKLAVSTNHCNSPSNVTFPSACRHILNDHRAILNTCTTSRTTILDDRAGTFFDLDLEISGRSLHAFKIRIGDELDV
jgi:hypothetical protein